jgi:hypothetical protein
VDTRPGTGAGTQRIALVVALGIGLYLRSLDLGAKLRLAPATTARTSAHRVADNGGSR